MSPSAPPPPPRTAPDDELDAVVNLESAAHAAGVSHSHAAGAAVGHSEGRALGWASGAQLCAEVSYYRGAASALLAMHEAHADCAPVSEKALASARRLADACARVALHERGNDEALDMEREVAELRGMFRALVAQAGVVVSYERAPSRQNDLSF